MNNNNWCVIMAGGIGSRFWPLSRNARPKQFLDILGVGKSFLQLTYERFFKIIPREHILIVTSTQFREQVLEQIPDIDPNLLLLEPLRRNTAPCIAYATYKILQRDPNARVVVAPSDHLVMGEDIFYSTIESALEFAGRDALITLGIKPARPETGYGYIQALRSKGEMINGNLAYPVKTFTEKPTAEMAKVLVDSGEFYWNSGIFIWNINSIERQLSELLPDISNLFKNSLDKFWTIEEEATIGKIYEECRSVSIDYGVMEKAPNCYVFPSTFVWSDMGSWESFYLYGKKDEGGNIVEAKQVMKENVKESIIVGQNEGKLIVVSNIERYMVIDTPQVLLVCPRDGGSFKQIINKLSFENEKYV